MGGDKIRPHDAISVQENDITAARGQDRAIADFGGAKAAVLVPDMREPVADLGLAGLDQLRGRRRRAVVGHHHLELLIGLARERAQHRRQRVCAVIGGDDDGHEFSHGLCTPRRRVIAAFPRC